MEYNSLDMVSATELKNDTTFVWQNNPYRVVKYAHQKLGRGGANIKLLLKNLKTGDLKDLTVSSNAKFEEIATIKKKMQYLYHDLQNAFFIDPKNFEQLEIPISLIEEEVVFLKDGDLVNVLFWEEKPLLVEIPPKVDLKVVDTPPGVKGNSASNIYKPATLENKMVVKVPLFINNKDIVRVDTRTKSYEERVKKA